MSAQFQAMAGTTRPVVSIKPVAGVTTDQSNHGTLRNAVSGSCIVGNGSMYATLPNAANSQNVSAFCWVKPTINGAVLQTFVMESGGSSQVYPWLLGMTATGEVRIILRDTFSVNGKDYRTTALLQDGEWAHIGFTYDGTDLRVFIDAEEQSVNRVVDNTLGNLLTSTSVGIGAKTTGELALSSCLTSIVCYNNELTASAIQDLLAFKYPGSAVYLLKLDESLGDVIYDSSGNENHGTVTNPYVSQWGKQYMYSYANQEGYTDNAGVRVPALTSLLDINGSSLQYKGKAQQNGNLVEAVCFQGDASAFCNTTFTSFDLLSYSDIEISIYVEKNPPPTTERWFSFRQTPGYLFSERNNAGNVSASFNDGVTTIGVSTTDYVNDFTEEFNKVTIKISQTTEVRLSIEINDVEKDFATTPLGGSIVSSRYRVGSGIITTRPVTQRYYGFKFTLDGADFAELSLSEPIIDATNHTYFDVSGSGNHSTLINGSIANEGVQDEYHYLEKFGYTLGTGSNGATLNHYIPASQATSTQDAAGNPLQFQPVEWLGLSKIKFPETPECIKADRGNFLFDVDGIAIAKTKTELDAVQGTWFYGGNNNYRLHLKDLGSIKDRAERKLTGN